MLRNLEPWFLLHLAVPRDRDFDLYPGGTFHQANQRRPEEITLREELVPCTSAVIGLDDFGKQQLGRQFV